MGYYGNSKHSASKKNYVKGKIVGRYMSEGKSYEEAKHIANAVIYQNLRGSFENGSGSRKAFKRGWHNGHDD